MSLLRRAVRTRAERPGHVVRWLYDPTCATL
jgi:hypothetical protein